MGQFTKNKTTKEIELKINPDVSKNGACDENHQKVNPKGYLLDKFGNIINKRGIVIWRSHELMYNEPPKIFIFS